MIDERIIINTKEEYDKVQNELLSKGYKWIDGTDTYFDIYEDVPGGFYKVIFIIHQKGKTFEWSFGNLE